MDWAQIAKWTLIAVIALGVAAYGTESGAQTPLMEKLDGDTYRLKVGEASLIVQGSYITGYSDPTNLALLAYWPDLSSEAGPEMTHVDSVRIRLKLIPRGSLLADYGQAASTRVRRLVGPERNGDLDATVYTDREANIRELRADHTTPMGAPFWIGCTRFGGRREDTTWSCRVQYPLNESIRLDYEYYLKHLPEWRAVDVGVREFALSLIEKL